MSIEPQSLQEAIKHFSDEQVCIDTVAALRWPDGVTCVSCGHKEHYWLKTQKRWKCKECWKQFSVKVGTIFEDSALSLDKWLVALWMLVNCRNGISSYEVARDLNISQKAAWFLLHRLRLALKDGSVEKMGGGGHGVEADETYVGGTPNRMHKSRREKINKIMANNYGVNKYAAGKTTVHGMLDRETRKVRAQVIPNVKRITIQERILNNIAPGAKVITDELPTYKYALADKFIHEVVNHAQTYVRGQVHTNGIENFWSLLKRGLRGTYVAVEPFHLDRYLDEQVFRFNHRKDADGKKLKDSDRFAAALSQIAGKRLTFAEVTGKVGETSN